jgi:hypothetical protein
MRPSRLTMSLIFLLTLAGTLKIIDKVQSVEDAQHVAQVKVALETCESSASCVTSDTATTVTGNVLCYAEYGCTSTGAVKAPPLKRHKVVAVKMSGQDVLNEMKFLQLSNEIKKDISDTDEETNESPRLAELTAAVRDDLATISGEVVTDPHFRLHFNRLMEDYDAFLDEEQSLEGINTI